MKKIVCVLALLTSATVFGAAVERVSITVQVIPYGGGGKKARPVIIRVNRNVKFGMIRRLIRERIGGTFELIDIVYGGRNPLDMEPLGEDLVVHAIVREAKEPQRRPQGRPRHRQLPRPAHDPYINGVPRPVRGQRIRLPEGLPALPESPRAEEPAR